MLKEKQMNPWPAFAATGFWVVYLLLIFYMNSWGYFLAYSVYSSLNSYFVVFILVISLMLAGVFLSLPGTKRTPKALSGLVTVFFVLMFIIKCYSVYRKKFHGVLGVWNFFDLLFVFLISVFFCITVWGFAKPKLSAFVTAGLLVGYILFNIYFAPRIEVSRFFGSSSLLWMFMQFLQISIVFSVGVFSLLSGIKRNPKILNVPIMFYFIIELIFKSISLYDLNRNYSGTLPFSCYLDVILAMLVCMLTVLTLFGLIKPRLPVLIVAAGSMAIRLAVSIKSHIEYYHSESYSHAPSEFNESVMNVITDNILAIALLFALLYAVSRKKITKENTAISPAADAPAVVILDPEEET